MKKVIGWINAKPKLAIGIGMALVLLVVAFMLLGRKKSTIQIQTQKVEKGMIVASVSASGTILTANLLNVTTSSSGIVSKVFVKDGDKVYKGQKIAEITLDSDGAKKYQSAYSSYLSAKNSLESAKISIWTLQSAEFAANQKFINDAVARNLTTDNPIYIQQYADWKAAEAKYLNQANVIAQSEASLANALLEFQNSSPFVYAPASGVISSITLAEGMSISSGGTSALRVAVVEFEGLPLSSFNFSEIDVSKIKQGQAATVKIDALGDKTFTGKVVTVDRVGTISSGVTNYPVIIRFDSKIPESLPNMSTSANIIIATKDNVLLVPSSAVQNQAGQNVIRVIREGKEETVSVEVGISSDTQTEIISGVSEGDEVVTGTISTGSTGTAKGTSVFGGGLRFEGGGAGGFIRR